jgi:DNA-binding transcriptional ArsR family regulator
MLINFSMSASFSMQEDFVLDTPARMKAVSHPLRLGILRCLREKEMTNQEIADTLDEPSGKLYFHTKKLLEAGMIELAGTRQSGSIVEKLYRTRVRSFIQPPGDGVDVPKLWAILQEGMHLYETTWREIGEPYHYGGQYIQYHSAETEQELVQALLALMDRFQTKAINPAEPGARALSLTTLLHRLASFPTNNRENSQKEEDTS